MALSSWLAFVAASAVLLIVPGPTILTVISYSLARGRAVRLPLVCAVALGDATALALSLLGLGLLLTVSAFWFAVVRWIGALYLVYLGINLWRNGFVTAELQVSTVLTSRWRLFANTWLVTALNPKGMVFFSAFLPQFVDPGGDAPFQLWLLAGTFVVLAAVNTLLYAHFAAMAARLLGSTSARMGLQRTGGGLLCGAGLWALLARRPG